MYFINITALHHHSGQWSSFKRKYGFSQTPAFIVFKNGSNFQMIQWSSQNGLSSSALQRWISKNKKTIIQSN